MITVTKVVTMQACVKFTTGHLKKIKSLQIEHSLQALGKQI